ncbi:glycosyltransferase family 2 protein [Agrobacterium sp. ES01]|uniref:glycosyltransferase family 2 protein n=1 Tax=Agrobacterium sp. ES01 TaxID=3420714 RepID=UPI003D0B2627
MIDSCERPDISFVIAAYNAQDTLARAIDSALAQTGVTVEVIVVDDCSADGTVALAEGYADPRVTLLQQAHNQGPAAARNAGISAARGRWIAVLDADDEVRPGRLRRMIDRAAVENADIVVDNLDVVPMDGGPAKPMFAERHLQGIHLLSLANFIQSNIIFRATYNYGYMKPIFARRFLLRHQLCFDESLKIGEDYMLLASALACGGRCAVEPLAGYIYHLWQGSISRVLEAHHLDAMLASDRLFLDRFTLHGAAAKAQRLRTRSLIEARSFITLIGEIKNRSIGGVLKTAIGHPRALRHLKMPLAVRVNRILSGAGSLPTAWGKRLQKGQNS